MSLTERQEKILNSLIIEYIDLAEPISSKLLNKKSSLGVSPATIRNELQKLTQQGYIIQPHTSAGRIPTQKAYRYFIEIKFSSSLEEFPNFIEKEIELARQKIENELELAQELIKSLTDISITLSYRKIQDKNSVFEILKIIGPSRTTYDKNISLINELIEGLENF